MNPQPTPPDVYSTPVAFEIYKDQDPLEVTGGVVVSPLGSIQVWTWLDPSHFKTDCANIGNATLLPLGDGATSHLLLSFTHDDTLGLGQVLPANLSPISYLVEHTAALVDSLTIRPLREFLMRALTRPEALHWYWRCPASRKDHHSYPGGLAMHSLEVAQYVPSARYGAALERELGIVYALLHDFGKLWFFHPHLSHLTEGLTHEELGLAKLTPSLNQLHSEDPMLAAIMRELLGGPPMPRQTRYPLAIRKVVKALDELSCEMTRDLLRPLKTAYSSQLPF